MKDSACCQGETGSNLFLGVKITDGSNTFWHRHPFHARISNGKLVIKEFDGVTKEWKDKTYYTSEFSQTTDELKDILLKCSLGQYDTELIQRKVEYVVDIEDTNTFLCPKEADETYLDIEYYEVFKDGVLAPEGTEEGEYILNGGDVFFTVAIPNVTDDAEPSDPYVITIYYWVKK